MEDAEGYVTPVSEALLQLLQAEERKRPRDLEATEKKKEKRARAATASASSSSSSTEDGKTPDDADDIDVTDDDGGDDDNRAAAAEKQRLITEVTARVDSFVRTFKQKEKAPRALLALLPHLAPTQSDDGPSRKR